MEKTTYTTVIGLEVHAQLLTQSKAYSPDSTEYGNMPNTNISVITLAHPGTLPRSNKTVVEFAVKMGLACGSEITRENIYDRKNYFYPDLPKGYQLTQDKTPICVGGVVNTRLKNGEPLSVQLTRIHMEEDAGKSMHLEGETDSLIDLNRAGVPLIEIVSEPDMRNSDEAYAYLTEIRKLVRYLDICDGNMEEGSLRCDANVSIMPEGSTVYGPRVEVKNMNSFRNVQRAIDYEVQRQTAVTEAGGRVTSETRMFDATTGETYSLRSKESLNDYRYFPEPDLQPIVISEAWLEHLTAQMPSLPHALHQKFTHEFGLTEYDAEVLTSNKETALWFEELCRHTTNYKAACNWVMGPVRSLLNELTLPISQFTVTPERLAQLIALIDGGKISFTAAAQRIFPAMSDTGEEPAALAEKLNLLQVSNTDTLKPIVDEVLAKNAGKVTEYKNGKKSLMGLFMGEVMKAAKGKADPKVIGSLLEESLNN